jgi:hypothetical protein
VLIPESSKVVKYELGTPTQVSIINPTAIQPSGVKVDSAEDIDFIDLINIPNNKSFSMFAKIINS